MENSNSVPLQNHKPLKSQGQVMSMSLDTLAEQLIKENSIIWYDSNDHTPKKDPYISALKKVGDVHLFTKWEEVSSYLKNPQVHCCQIIISDANEEPLVKEISQMQQIVSIYIVNHQDAPPKTWSKHYPKVVCIENDLKDLMEKIEESLMLWQKTKTSSTEEEIIIKKSVSEVIKHFVKESLVVWYDPSGHSAKNLNHINDLKYLSDIQIFADREEAVKYIEKTQVFLLVIASGSDAELFMKEINHLQNVSRVYVLCFDNDNDKHQTWIKPYGSKVVKIQKGFPSLFDKIKRQILRHDLPSFAPIFDHMDLSDINYLHCYLRGLVNFRNRHQAKEDFLALATAFFEASEGQFITDFKESYNQYDKESILKWYTKECFLYKLVNNCLRAATSDSIQYSRLVLRDIETAIKENYQQQSHNFSGLLYRGAYMNNEEWARLQQNLGHDIEMHGFLSTSKNKDVASSFSQYESQKKVFITIIVPKTPVESGQGFAEMEACSDSPDEVEVLFNVRSRFTVLETTMEMIDKSDKSEMRHLVLLYGGQEIRKLNKQQNPYHEISINSTHTFECNLCKNKIDIKGESILTISIYKDKEFVCQSCLQNPQIAHPDPLVCISPLAHDLSSSGKIIKVEGTLAKYQDTDNLNIPFYGYKCCECEKVRPNRCYTCLDCKDIKRIYCDACFFSQQGNKCIKKGHRVIHESYPYSFWPEKMSEDELRRINHFEEELFRTNVYFRQPHVFSYAHNYQNAVMYYKKLLEKKFVLTKEQEAESYHNLGRAYESLGEYQNAVEQYSEAIKMWKSLFGENNSAIAASIHNLGSAYKGIENYQDARKCFSTALNIQLAVLGREHKDTSNSYHSLASVCEILEEFKQADEYYLQALDIRKQVFGDKHPEIATTYNNLGSLYQKMGDYQKAINNFSTSLAIQKVIYGDKHPKTATSYNNLGSVSHNMGEHQKAIEYYSKGLEIAKIILGDKHSQTSGSYNNLGSVYLSSENYQKAIEYFSKALEIDIAASGLKSTEIATTYNNLGLAYFKQADYKQAEEYYIKALEIHKEIFGNNHTSTATSNDNLGSLYLRMGNLQKADEYYSTALKIRQAALRENHTDIAISYNNIGSLFGSLEKYREAIEYYFRALEIIEARFGKKHAHTITYYNNIGEGYQNIGQYSEAQRFFLISLKIAEKTYGDNHVLTASCSQNLGSAYIKPAHIIKNIEDIQDIEGIQNFKNIQTGFEYSLKALDIREKVLGDHPETALSYNSIGFAFLKFGKNQEAEENFLIGLDIQENLFGDMRRETANSYINLGSTYHYMLEFHKAEKCHSKALEITKVIFGENHLQAAICYRHLAFAYESLGQPQKALEYLKKARKIRMEKLGNDHPLTLELDQDFQDFKKFEIS